MEIEVRLSKIEALRLPWNFRKSVNNQKRRKPFFVDIAINLRKNKNMSRTFDEYVMLIAKWIVVLVGFAIIFAFQFIWFVIFPLVKILHKKFRRDENLQTDMNFFTPIEWYGKMVRRFFGLD